MALQCITAVPVFTWWSLCTLSCNCLSCVCLLLCPNSPFLWSSNHIGFWPTLITSFCYDPISKNVAFWGKGGWEFNVSFCGGDIIQPIIERQFKMPYWRVFFLLSFAFNISVCYLNYFRCISKGEIWIFFLDNGFETMKRSSITLQCRCDSTWKCPILWIKQMSEKKCLEWQL